MQDVHGNIRYLFDFWADPFVHLLLLKSSMAQLFPQILIYPIGSGNGFSIDHTTIIVVVVEIRFSEKYPRRKNE